MYYLETNKLHYKSNGLINYDNVYAYDTETIVYSRDL